MSSQTLARISPNTPVAFWFGFGTVRVSERSVSAQSAHSQRHSARARFCRRWQRETVFEVQDVATLKNNRYIYYLGFGMMISMPFCCRRQQNVCARTVSLTVC